MSRRSAMTRRNLGVTWQPLTGSGCAGHELRHFDQHHCYGGDLYRASGLTTGITVSLEAIAKANGSVTSTATITIVLPVTFTTTISAERFQRRCVQPNHRYQRRGRADHLFRGDWSLPAGLKLNSVGTMIGTPSSSGTSIFTINATDFGTPPLTVPSPIYTITINPPPPLSITSTAMANGIVGTAYSSPIASSGGVPPLTGACRRERCLPGLN